MKDWAKRKNRMGKHRKHFAGVQALIFDLDGTLIDSRQDLVLSVNAARGYLDLPPLEESEIASYVGRGAQALIQRAVGEGIGEQQVAEAFAYFLDYYRGHMLDHTVAYPGVRQALDLLARWPMAVLTNKPVRFSRAILEGLGLARHFRYVYGGNSFERKKPDPMGLQVLLRDFGVAALEAMLVGDSEVDVQTARNGGAWAAGVTYGLDPASLDRTPPDLLLDSLMELPTCLDENIREDGERQGADV